DPPSACTQLREPGRRFLCRQVNVLRALPDFGPGDGGTMLIPGSHKANFRHPYYDEQRMGEDRSVDGTVGAVEVFMKAGDALVFVDGISHGSAKRMNAGTRRIVVYRYGPSWGNFRHGYQPSPELLERLTPQRRRIVQPQVLLPREPQVKRGEG
ncbi:MAG: phytanoyl-CoA dioxygenase family protein, partial [Gemmatimonadetes bacterium]|nr:phytanoyl-CoA dioxygenase family protein [Gemmatimonadota bacterium]